MGPQSLIEYGLWAQKDQKYGSSEPYRVWSSGPKGSKTMGPRSLKKEEGPKKEKLRAALLGAGGGPPREGELIRLKLSPPRTEGEGCLLLGIYMGLCIL